MDGFVTKKSIPEVNARGTAETVFEIKRPFTGTTHTNWEFLRKCGFSIER